MHVYGPSQLHGAQPINAPHINRAAHPSSTTATPATADQLDISDAARLAERISEIPDIRADRVAEIRAAIERGTYDSADKIEIAVSRLLDEIG